MSGADTIMASSLTSDICRFASDLRFADIPVEVRCKASLHILDSLGCGIAGASSSLARSILEFLRLEHSDGKIPIIGTSICLGPAAAAFANSASMNALDYDDGFEIRGKGMGHPGATIVAAAFGAPFMKTTDGKTFLTGIVAAYEINNRLAHAIQPSIRRFRKVYGVCQHQSVGAAIAYAKIVGFDARALENVIGLASLFANVPSLRKYNFEARPLISFKDMNAPVARTGVQAVQLHASGMIGSKAILDGPFGLWRMLGSDRFMPDRLAAGLGDSWTIMDSAFKAYPACRWMHASLEAFEKLMRDHSLSPEAIDEVIVRTSEGMARDFMDRSPATMVDAQFSFPYAFAALAYGLRPAAEWYSEGTLRRADLRRFAERVRAEIDPEVDALMSGPLRRPAGRVDIIAAGKRFSSPLIEYALGSQERPLDEERILAKFMDNAVPVIGPDKATGIVESVLGTEDEPDMARVLGLAAIR